MLVFGALVLSTVLRRAAAERHSHAAEEPTRIHAAAARRSRAAE